TDAEPFLATAQALENTGVSAYTGAAQYLIDSDELLTAALTIHGVEARHAAYLNLLNGENPFPMSFDEPLNPAEVVEIAGGFIVDAEVVTPEAFEPEEDEEGTPES
ncbi:MAG: ferritin-like domain-containing protein, partial [Chloroflexota bacterium]|nr:ferritin-like domain-containing protein [Chloroflexota bacterium]